MIYACVFSGMKKQLLIYYATFILLFALISLSRGWFSAPFLAFWLGGALGVILPDIDHIIYIYLLKPHELTSQRAARMISRREIWSTLNLLATTRTERTSLVFHNAMFQLVFSAFAFFVITSSTSLFGRGVVVAFLLHLLVDQYLDFNQLGSISHWTRGLNISLNREKTAFYWAGMGILLVLFGFVF